MRLAGVDANPEVGSLRDDELDDDAALRLYLVIGRLVRLLRRDGVAELGPGAFSALVTLAKAEPMRLGDLAAREAVAPPTLTRIVAALEEAGYVRREPDPADGRAVLVGVTPVGRDLVRGVRTARAATLRRRIAALAPSEHTALVAALPALERLVAEQG
jgi:DNA-binding MarR family transcriptional regulator